MGGPTPGWGGPSPTHLPAPQWLSAGQTEASVYQQAENGKTELSLMHFAITNPRWQPPPPSELFLSHLKEKVQQDAAAAPPAQRILAEGPLGASLLSDDSATAVSGTGGGAGGILGVSGHPDVCLHSRTACWPASWPDPSSRPAGWWLGTGALPSLAAPPALPPASWPPWRPLCPGGRVDPLLTALAAKATDGSPRRGPAHVGGRGT